MLCACCAVTKEGKADAKTVGASRTEPIEAAVGHYHRAVPVQIILLDMRYNYNVWRTVPQYRFILLMLEPLVVIGILDEFGPRPVLCLRSPYCYFHCFEVFFSMIPSQLSVGLYSFLLPLMGRGLSSFKVHHPLSSRDVLAS
jgi:hypothetical protein